MIDGVIEQQVHQIPEGKEPTSNIGNKWKKTY